MVIAPKMLKNYVVSGNFIAQKFISDLFNYTKSKFEVRIQFGRRIQKLEISGSNTYNVRGLDDATKLGGFSLFQS